MTVLEHKEFTLSARADSYKFFCGGCDVGKRSAGAAAKKVPKKGSLLAAGAADGKKYGGGRSMTGKTELPGVPKEDYWGHATHTPVGGMVSLARDVLFEPFFFYFSDTPPTPNPLSTTRYSAVPHS